ncbi:anthranilate synthase component I, partial [mine drainage metagenome]
RLVYFHPDSTEKGEYIRNKPFTGNPFSGDSTDKELEGKIRKMIRSIREGEMLQIVLSREFGPLDVDPVERFFSFLSNDRSMYVFFYRIGPYMVLGSSPENLITRSGRRVMIEPIAGTRKISMDPVSNLDMEKELLSDRKELQEHRMLVDLA